MKKLSKISVAVSVVFLTQVSVSAQVLNLTEGVKLGSSMLEGGFWTIDRTYDEEVRDIKSGKTPKYAFFQNSSVRRESFTTIGESGVAFEKIQYFVPSTKVQGYDVPKIGVLDIGRSGSGFVILEGVVQGVKYLRSPEFNPPGAAAVSSCRSKTSTITDSVAIGTIATTMVQSATSVESSREYSNKVTKSIGVDTDVGKFGIGVALKTSQTWETAESYGRKNNTTTTDAWTDTNSFLHTFSSTTAIPGGVTVVPTVTTPLVEIYGRFKMGAVFQPGKDKDKALTSMRDNNLHYMLYTGGALNRANGNSVWTGKIVAPASELKILEKSGLLPVPHWFPKENIMSVPFYVKQCPTDIITKNYALVMKPALCKVKDKSGKLVYPTACK